MESLIFNHKVYISATDPAVLKKDFEQLLIDSDLEIVGFTEKYFDPKGYTCVWILAESHLAIHTFPEHGQTYVELSSCNQEKNKAFIDLLNTRFKHLL